MNFRRFALLAAIGLAPIILAVTLAAAEVARGFGTTVYSSSAAYAGDVDGRPAVVALTDAASLPSLRVGQRAQVFVPTLEENLPGRVMAVSSDTRSLPSGFDPIWLVGSSGADRARQSQVLVALDSADPRLAPGTSVGVRILVSAD